MFNKILLSTLLSILLINITNSEYKPVDCSINSNFEKNFCNQCFDGGKLEVGDSLSFLDDIWFNNTTNKKIMYKEEQKMPTLINLNGAEFLKKPNDNTFWEYTAEFEALNNKEFNGYILPAGQKVSWLKSSIGAGYRLDKAPNNGNDAGILIYDIISHDILPSGEIVRNTKFHKECVIFQTGTGTVKTSIIPEVSITPEEETFKKEEMTKVKAGPENYFLILIISLMLGILIFNKKLILKIIKN